MHQTRKILAVVVVMALAGCALFQPADNTGDSGEITESPTPAASPPADSTPDVDDGSDTGGETLPEGEVVLTVWTAAAHAPSSETDSGQVLLEQLSNFDQAQPDIRVQVLVKSASGPGSTLSYLRSAPSAAPDILPDLVLLDRSTLLQAANEGLVVPLGDLVSPELVNRLYPVAQELGTVSEQVMGIPYVLQMTHTVYRETLFEQQPVSFSDVLDSPVPFVFPAGTIGDVSRVLLGQYLSMGGTLTDEEGAPYLDAAVLASLLTFYDEARDLRVVDPILFQLNDANDSWVQFRDRQAGYAAVLSTTYLGDSADLRSVGLAWIPTQSGEPFAMVSGWLWAVTTTEPGRQAAAMALVNYLMDEALQGAYTQAAGWLPSQAGALAVWGANDRYASFGDSLLQQSVVLPDPAVRSSIGTAMQNALEDVLLNGISPVSAANSAAQLVNREESSDQ